MQNPGFETGDFTSWTESKWGLSNVGLNLDTYQAITDCSGDSCINGTAAQQASLSQTIATVSGQSYTFSFFFTPDGQTPNELKVLFGNTVAFDLVNSPNSAALLPYSTTVTATSNSTTITFLGREDPNLDRLDNVSVNAAGTSAPEPGTFALGIPLLAAAVFAARRKRA